MRTALGYVCRHKAIVSLLVVVMLAAVGWAAWSRWTAGQLLRQGEEALAARNYTGAHDYLERYLSVRPGDARARLLAARSARRLRSYYEAREHLDRCRKDGGDAEAIAVEDALIDVQRGDERPVAELRQRAERDDKLALVILEVLIQHDLDTDQLWLALRGLTRYLSQCPDDLQALLGRASVWEQFLSFKDALEDYRRAVAAHPENERARLHLADTLLIAGTPSEALTQYRWLEEKSPQRPEVRLGLCALLAPTSTSPRMHGSCWMGCWRKRRIKGKFSGNEGCWPSTKRSRPRPSPGCGVRLACSPMTAVSTTRCIAACSI